MEDPMHIGNAFRAEAATRLRSQPAFLQPVSLGFHYVNGPQLPKFARPEAGEHVLSDDLRVIHASLRRDAGIHVIADPALQEGPNGLIRWLDERFLSAFLNESAKLALRRTLGTREHPAQATALAGDRMG